VSQTNHEAGNVPEAGAAQMPAYDAAGLASRDCDALIALLIQDEDRVPRALVDECAGRGEAMAERLAALVAPQSRWSGPESDGEWWLRLHAVMILGLIEGERAGRLLVSFMRRMERANDDDLQDWLAGYWPIYFRNKPDSVAPALRTLAHDRSLDWYMRIQAVGAVIAMAERGGADALEEALDWAAAIAADEAQEWDMRLAVASDLLGFPRERYRPLLKDLAKRQAGPGAFFGGTDVAEAYAARRDRPEWHERNDPWAFYEPSAIAERQERWAREAAEEAGEEDFSEPMLPFVRESPKTGRNDPCPCGSGKKYKKCCLDGLDG
jgi:hypothetical protein